MEKIKSRWRKNYLEGDIINTYDAKDINNDQGGFNNINSINSNENSTNLNISYNGTNHNHLHNSSNNSNINNNNANNNHHSHRHHSSSKHSAPPTFEPLVENLYLDRRKNEHSRSRKDARSMVCDCILTKEERARGVMGCLDDCLNRMLMIECGPKCTLGEHCLNKRFQKFQSAKVEVFKTRKKGWGLRTTTDLPAQSFIMEYVGEVIQLKKFRSRVKKYTKQKIKHHYFMALRSDEIIDATVKGNLTRFINHSCEPNSETQKWTVNGDLRIGFFTMRNLVAGEEITFDYQFQRYGRKAQKCYCEAPSCRGYIGGNDQTFSLNGTSTSPQPNENSKAHKKPYKHGLLLDVTLEDKIKALAEAAAQGLKTKDQVIALASLSIKAEEIGDRRKLLDIIKTTKSEITLRLFVDYHGLEILCLWMRDPQADCDFKATIIYILEKLPIPNKTKVLESNVYRMIERWATEEAKSNTVPPTAENALPDPHTTPTKRRKDDDEDQSENKQQEVDGVDVKTNNDSQPSLQLTPTKRTSSSASNTLLQAQNVNTPNIKALACKLLKKFQALSPGFKIPRLNRLQRMEIEKKMEEEIISDELANNDKLVAEQKNPFASRNYFKTTTTTTNGLVNSISTIKTNTLTNKRRFDSLTTNNIDLTPTPKMSKEEHRQQFEMSVRLKDYYDKIEKHYGAAAVEQIKLSQRTYPTVNGLSIPYPHLTGHNLAFLNSNHRLAPAIPPPLLVASQPQQSTIIPTPPTATTNAVSHLIYPNVSALTETDSRYQQPIVVGSTATIDNYHLASHLQSNGQQADAVIAYQLNGTRDHYNTTDESFLELYSQQHHQKQEPEPSSVNDVEMVENPTKPKPTNLPTLIVLANNSIEAAHAIDDELAFSICDYDKNFSNRDKPLTADDVLDQDSNPHPGCYYKTPNGEAWFATVTLDRKTQQPRTVIINLSERSESIKLK